MSDDLSVIQQFKIITDIQRILFLTLSATLVKRKWKRTYPFSLPLIAVEAVYLTISES